MFMAVSTLSPVNTQTFIPAYFINCMVSDTSYWRRSSIAVEPTNSKFTSIFSSTWATNYSRFFIASRAYRASLNHCSNSCSGIIRYANISVRRPSSAKSFTLF
jgi:hypothetical protein